MIRDLMLPMTGTAGDAHALEAAIALARSLDAHLTVVESVDLPAPFPSPWGLTNDAAMATVYDVLRERGRHNADGLRQRLQPETMSWEVRVVESLLGEPARNISLHARYSDLSVMSAAPGASKEDAAVVRAFFSALLFESGRPLLAIPPQHPVELPISHAVVAWQATREATRALHDALPLLRSARTVDVVTVADEGANLSGNLPGATVATHLARHGIKVNVVTRAPGGDSVATALLRQSVESGAQLLVVGGFGHSRLREWAIGGTTRELLQEICLPILFSH